MHLPVDPTGLIAARSMIMPLDTAAVAESRKALWVLTAISAVVLLWSGIGPYDRLTWWLEVLPVIIAVPLLWAIFCRSR
jgi:putative membrane protein